MCTNFRISHWRSHNSFRLLFVFERQIILLSFGTKIKREEELRNNEEKISTMNKATSNPRKPGKQDANHRKNTRTCPWNNRKNIKQEQGIHIT